MFKDSLLDGGAMGKTKQPAALAASFLTQTAVLGIMALIPLLYGEALPAYRLMTTLVALPPPPQPPAPAAVQPVRVRPKFAEPQAFVGPVKIPKRVAIVVEDPIPNLVTGTVPGGTAAFPDNFFNRLANRDELPPPPPATPVVQAPIAVGGSVAAAKLISQPKPTYPPLAIQTRTQGTVHLQALIGKEGTIENLTVISGHPLLVQAALDAVKQWRYRPTMLNGQAVEVVTTVEVNFTLGH